MGDAPFNEMGYDYWAQKAVGARTYQSQFLRKPNARIVKSTPLPLGQIGVLSAGTNIINLNAKPQRGVRGRRQPNGWLDRRNPDAELKAVSLQMTMHQVAR